MHCSILQYVAVCCSVLQCVAVCCSATYEYVAAAAELGHDVGVQLLQCVAMSCVMLQRVAVCCSVLQCVAMSWQQQMT